MPSIYNHRYHHLEKQEFVKTTEIFIMKYFIRSIANEISKQIDELYKKSKE